MKKFSEAVLAKHKHMSHKASPFHAHSQGLEYTPSGKAVVRPIDTADAGYGGEAVSDAEGGEADAGIASKKAVSPMKMQTLVKKTNEGFDPSSADIAKELVAKHGKNVTKDHIRALEQDRDSNKGLNHNEIMKHVKKLQEETERERLMKLRSFAYKQKVKGLGADIHEPVSEEASPMIKPPKGGFDKKSDAHAHAEKHGGKVYKHTFTHSNGQQTVTYHVKEEAEQIDELKKSTLASYAKKAADEVSYHSFTAGTMSPKDPERLATDKMAMKRQRGVEKAIDKLAKEEVEQIDEMDKSQPSSSRGAEGLATGTKATPVTREKAAADALKLLKKNVKPMKEEVELDEMSPEARKNKMRTMGVNAAIQHPKKVDFAGGAIQMYRQAVKKLSSKEMSDVAKKLPSVKEENDGTEADAGEYGYEGDMAMSQLKSIIRNAQSLHDHMEPQTDLPEWVQSKITLAADYIQTAADYWRSEKEEAMNEGKAEVRADTHQAIKDFLAKGGKITKFAPSKATHRPGTALGSKHIGNMAQKPGLARNVGKGGKPLVAVEEGKMKDIATNKAEDERLAKLKAMAKKPEPKAAPVPRVGPMDKVVEEEVWDKPMPDSKKQGSLSPEQKAKAKARAERAGRSYPNMVDNIWASKQ